jgi:hypothetical protein
MHRHSVACFRLVLCGRRHQKSYVPALLTMSWEWREKSMVYCTKCGTNNVEGAKVCVNCGAPLYGSSGGGGAYEGRVRYERRYHSHMRSGTIAGLVLGVIVIFIGLSLLLEQYSIKVPWFEILLILLGVYLIWRWFSFRNRRR